MDNPGMADLDAAIEFATKAHRGQRREGEVPLPYITHPMEVLMNLRYLGGIGDPDMLCAAILHDTVEETNVTLPEIETRFGPTVRHLVEELTRREPTAEETRGMSKDEIWELRSKMLLDEIAKMSPEAQKIKLADRYSNLKEAQWTKSGEKLKRYEKQTAKILKIVPKQINPGLWNAINVLREKIEGK